MTESNARVEFSPEAGYDPFGLLSEYFREVFTKGGIGQRCARVVRSSKV